MLAERLADRLSPEMLSRRLRAGEHALRECPDCGLGLVAEPDGGLDCPRGCLWFSAGELLVLEYAAALHAATLDVGRLALTQPDLSTEEERLARYLADPGPDRPPPHRTDSP
jgi:hypothetical protein